MIVRRGGGDGRQGEAQAGTAQDRGRRGGAGGRRAAAGQSLMAASPETAPAISARPEGEGRFTTIVEVPRGPILADEPVAVGGGGAGPTPYQLLSAALAACTSMTIRLYAARRLPGLPRFRVEVEHALIPGDPPRDRFTRSILVDGLLSGEERARLIDIAGKCPVHRTLSGAGAEIVTGLEAPAPSPPPVLEPADPPAAHVEQMAQACADCGGAGF